MGPVPLIHFALEAHSAIEKRIFELWNEEYRDGRGDNIGMGVHYIAVTFEVLWAY